MLVWVAGHIDNVDGRILQHCLEICVGLDTSTMGGADLIVVQQSGGKNCGNLTKAGVVDCVDMSAGRPSVSNDANVEFFHNGSSD